MVAGGGLGMGLAVVEALADAGASVVVVDVDRARAEAAAGRGGPGSIAIEADVRNEDRVDKLVEEVNERCGGFDALVSVVGGTQGLAPRVPLVETTADDWDRVTELNLRHFFLLARVSAKHFIQRGIAGSMVNISSVNGIVTAPNHAAYGAAKAGLMSLTRSLSLELGPEGIRINSIAPGAIYTARSADAYTADYLERAQDLIPLGRLGQVEDVAGAVLFLLSDLSAYVTGQTLVVDGGITNAYPFDLQKIKD